MLLLPELFREAFTDLDTTLESEGVHLLKCDPNYNVYFSDGERMALSTDLAAMKLEIERFEGKDGFERYLSFLAESHRHYELSVTHVLKRNYKNLLAMVRPAFVKCLFALHPFHSVYGRASKYFWTERLRRVFTFSSMYMGMSPFEAPGTYSLLQYTELAEGIWYPVGGFNKVMTALVGVGERYGVQFRFGTAVKEVLIEGGVAKGAITASGEKIVADVVIVNADLVYAYNNLLPKSSYAKTLKAKKTSCSSISFYWSLSTTIPELSAHNIFLAENFKSSFDDIFKRHSLPAEPSFYINVPSRIDRTAAPDGKDSVVVLVPVGHLHNATEGIGLDASNEQDWANLISKARSTILETVKARVGIDIASLITNEIVNDPRVWEEKFNLDRGAILGLSHSFFNVLSFRPKTKHGDYKNLFFVGASTHPGTGVPICLAGAKITSEQVLESFGVEAPWKINQALIEGKDTGKKKSELDHVQNGGGMLDLVWIAIAVAIVTMLVAMVMGRE